MSASPSDLLIGNNSVIPEATPATPIESKTENPECNCSAPAKKVCSTHFYNWILLLVLCFLGGGMYIYMKRKA